MLTQTDGITLASTRIEYYSKDQLGSIVAITDQTGAVTQRLSYDVWGKRRYPNGAADPNGLLNNPDMYHGFTGHEMLDDVGLIHMNGRLYDPVLARFVSADFLIEDPSNLQSYNRFSYVWNNPLNRTDASGQCIFCVWAIAGAIFARATGIIDTQTARGIIGIAVGAWLGPAGEFGKWLGGGFTQAVVTGGIVGGISSGWNGIAPAMLSAGLFNAAGSFAQDVMGGEGTWAEGGFGHAMAHAVAGCVGASATGGNCGNGALSAGFAAFAGPKFEFNNDVANLISRSVIGGAASVLGGGKFGNGAMTGAFGYLFNYCAHNGCFENKPFGFAEAKDQWRNGNGGTVTRVKASEVDLTGATYVKNADGSYQIHTSLATETGRIYGTLTGVLNVDGTMSFKRDYYNFDMKKLPKAGSFWESARLVVRNVLTWGGEVINGSGKPYYIEFSGSVPAPKDLPR